MILFALFAFYTGLRFELCSPLWVYPRLLDVISRQNNVDSHYLHTEEMDTSEVLNTYIRMYTYIAYILQPSNYKRYVHICTLKIPAWQERMMRMSVTLCVCFSFTTLKAPPSYPLPVINKSNQKMSQTYTQLQLFRIYRYYLKN